MHSYHSSFKKSHKCVFLLFITEIRNFVKLNEIVFDGTLFLSNPKSIIMKHVNVNHLQAP